MAEAPETAIDLSEARRDWNRERSGFVSELRCECAQPSCKDWLPVVAEAHRGIAGRFVVTPDHVNGSVVVRAADRFFVIQ